jgi:hypothetical protein
MAIAAACAFGFAARTKHRRVAVINTLEWHYECMGHVLECMKDRGIAVDVYMIGGYDGSDGSGWAAMYTFLFRASMADAATSTCSR